MIHHPSSSAAEATVQQDYRFPAVPPATSFSHRSLLVRAALPASLSRAQGSCSPGAPNHSKTLASAAWEPGEQQPAWIPGDNAWFNHSVEKPSRAPQSSKTNGSKRSSQRSSPRHRREDSELSRGSAGTHRLFTLTLFAEEESSSQ